MFALPPLVALVVFILARPLDFVQELRRIPFLYIFAGLAAFGWILDARLGYARLRATPGLKWALGILALAVVSGVAMAPDRFGPSVVALVIVLTIFVLVSQSIQRFKALEMMASAVLVSSLWVAGVCVHQGLQPLTCVAVDPEDHQSVTGHPDGRSCETIEACYEDPPEPQAIYRCEHTGLSGITSVAGGRVRYLGVLQDPNEVALMVSVAVPLAVALYVRRRKRRYLLLAVGAAALAACTVVMSGSRSGVLVLLTVCAVYLLKRFRWRGALAASLVSLPLLVLGGRSDRTAAQSTSERLEAWIEGMRMVRAHPILGVGHGQFPEHHPVTAHNAVLLAAAEVGLLGAVLWAGVVYLSLKIPFEVLRQVEAPEGAVARTWALALLASVAGAGVGSMFLSFNYHFVLWIYVGLSGALSACVQRHLPSFRVRFGLGDLALVTGSSAGVLGVIFIAAGGGA